MMKFYYTFGMDERYPYQGGWVEVIASDFLNAHAAFRKKYPDRKGNEGCLNCASYYNEHEFKQTEMYETSNYGRFCMDIIFAEDAQDDTLVRYRFLVSSADDCPSAGRDGKRMEDLSMPWWQSASGFGFVVLICYLPKNRNLLDFWEGAYEIEYEEKAQIEYTDRFPKPDWIPEDTIHEKRVSECPIHRDVAGAQELWRAFGDVPMDPKTETIEQEWHGFPMGTHREDIWHWFEETFGVSVAEDLMFPDTADSELLWTYELHGFVSGVVSGIVYAVTKESAERKVREAYEGYPAAKHATILIKRPKEIRDVKETFIA